MRLEIEGEKGSYTLGWIQQVLGLYGFSEDEIEAIANLRPGESISLDGLKLTRIS